MTTLDEVLAVVRETQNEVRALRMLIEARAEGAVASSAELDSDRGDPKVRFDPKTWRGASFKNKRMSEAPAAYLDHLARALAAIAEKEDSERKLYKNKPASIYTRKDAARARGWALRKRMAGEKDDDAPVRPAPSAFGASPIAAPPLAAPPIGAPSGFEDDLDEFDGEEFADEPM